MTILKKLIVTITFTAFLAFSVNIDAAAQEQSVKQAPSQDKKEHDNTTIHQQSLENFLLISLLNKDSQKVTTYLQAGADVNAADKNFLITAICLQHEEFVKQLLTYKANANYISNRYNHTPLQFAINAQNIAIIQLLLDHKARVDSIDPAYKPILRHAIEQKTPCHPDIIKLLIENNAPLDAIDHKENTPLGVACAIGYIQAARALIEGKANINLADNHTHTPLFYATHFNHPQIVHLLLEHKASVDVIDKQGITPLGAAINNGSASITRMLLESKASVDPAQRYNGWPLFTLASNLTQPSPELIKIMLEHFLGNQEAEKAYDQLNRTHKEDAHPDNPTLLTGKLACYQRQTIQQIKDDCGVHALTNAISIDTCINAHQSLDSPLIQKQHVLLYPHIAPLIKAINSYQNIYEEGTSKTDLMVATKRDLSMDNCCALSNKNNTIEWHTSNQPLDLILWGVPDYSGPLSHNVAINTIIDNLKSKSYGAVHFLCNIELIHHTIASTNETNHWVTISIIKDPQTPQPYILYQESNNLPLESQPDAQRWINFINAYYGSRLLDSINEN